MIKAIIIPTDNCNLRCKHCLRASYKEKDLEIDTLRKFLDGYCQQGFRREFTLTGGEPTMHGKFSEILGVLKEYYFYGLIATNGQDEAKMSDLINYSSNISVVSVSLEGPENINDSIRGKGSFKKAVKSIELLQKNGIKVWIRMTLSSKNASHIQRMFSLGEMLNVDQISFLPVIPCLNSKNDILKVKDLKKYHSDYEKISRKFKIHSNFMLDGALPYTQPDWPGPYCCYADDKISRVILRPNGDVEFCSFLYDFGFDVSRHSEKRNENKLNSTLGNVNKDHFGDILERRKALINTLTTRRRHDAATGKLTGARQYFCENCRFYFYKNA